MIYLVSNQVNAFDRVVPQITLSEAINILKDIHILGLDTETQGLDPYTKELLTVQLGNKDVQIVFDIESFQYKVPKELKELLESDHLFILQNAKFDLKFLYHQNIVLSKVYDTMLVETILTNGMQYDGRGLQDLVNKYCNEYLDKTVRGTIITKGLTSDVILYAARDVVFLEEIMEKQLRQVKQFDLIGAVNVDNAFVKVLAYIEYCGIKLDFQKWKARSLKNIDTAAEFKKKLDEYLVKKQLFKWVDMTPDLFTNELRSKINWDSPKQVIELFNYLGIKTTIKVKGVDKVSIDAKKVLAAQEKKFDILTPYLKYKEQQTLVGTFGLNWEKFINSKTKRIHTTFKQLMDTGRLSCGDKNDKTPNLQNLPSDAETRACFIPEKGNVLIDADFSSQEQRVLANFSKEENLLNFYAKGLQDMHSYVAFLMYPDIRTCEIAEVTNEVLLGIKKKHSDKRKLAKNAGFAINYGGNGSTIAKNCNIPIKDGEFVYESYFRSFPGLRTYFDTMLHFTQKRGYVTFNGVTKRKYFFRADTPFLKYQNEINDPMFYNNPEYKEILKEYNKSLGEAARISQNYPIQGSSADISKIAGIYFFNEIIKRGWLWKVKIVNMVHDEYLVEAPEALANEVSNLLVSCMCKAGDVFCKIVPLGAEADMGDHWIH